MYDTILCGIRKIDIHTPLNLLKKALNMLAKGGNLF